MLFVLHTIACSCSSCIVGVPDGRCDWLGKKNRTRQRHAGSISHDTVREAQLQDDMISCSQSGFQPRGLLEEMSEAKASVALSLSVTKLNTGTDQDRPREIVAVLYCEHWTVMEVHACLSLSLLRSALPL